MCTHTHTHTHHIHTHTHTHTHPHIHTHTHIHTHIHTHTRTHTRTHTHTHTLTQLPDDRIDLELPSHAHHQFRHQPHPHGTPPTSQVPRPYPTNTHSTAPTARSHAVRGSEAIKLEPNQDFIAQQLSSLHNLPHSLLPISSASLRSSLTFTQATCSGSRSMPPSNPGVSDPGSQPAYSFPPRLGHVPLSSSSGGSGTGNVSMEFGHSLLTPEQFQQPVQMLSSLQHQQLHVRTSTFGGSGSSGAVFGHHGQPQGGGGQSVPLMPDFMSPLGTRLDISQKKRRRTSSTSGPSLDDQGRCYVIRVVRLPRLVSKRLFTCVRVLSMYVAFEGHCTCMYPGPL